MTLVSGRQHINRDNSNSAAENFSKNITVFKEINLFIDIYDILLLLLLLFFKGSGKLKLS